MSAVSDRSVLIKRARREGRSVPREPGRDRACKTCANAPAHHHGLLSEAKELTAEQGLTSAFGHEDSDDCSCALGHHLAPQSCRVT